MDLAITREAAARRLSCALALAGWTVVSIDVDLCAERARVELRRGDLAVTLDASRGRASLTRELMVRRTVAVGRRGDRFRTERLGHEFIGRTHACGARSGLRALCNYIEDNSAAALPRGGVRALMAGVLAGTQERQADDEQ